MKHGQHGISQSGKLVHLMKMRQRQRRAKVRSRQYMTDIMHFRPKRHGHENVADKRRQTSDGNKNNLKYPLGTDGFT